MKFKLGYIISESHLYYLNKLKEEFKDICDIEFFVYYEINEIVDHYYRNRDVVDAFILSGELVYIAMTDKVKEFEKPVYILAEDEYGLYKKCFKILMNDRNIDFSRVYVDFYSMMHMGEEFKDLFPSDRCPYFLPTPKSDAELIANTILNNHINLWNEGRIDFSITACGHLKAKLENLGIKYYFIHPSLNCAKELLIRILNELEVNYINKTKTIVALISNEGNKKLNKTNFYIIENLVIEYMKRYKFMYKINVLQDQLEIFITHSDFLVITDNLNTCTLLNYIINTLDYDIKIGWGAGFDLYQAINNSLKAFKQAKVYDGSCSFFVDENLKVIGPLIGSYVLELDEKISPEVLRLSEHIGINSANLQKILSYASKIGSNKFSSSDIANCLLITIKGANRILNIIEKNGYAMITYEKVGNKKGRPIKYYIISFINSHGKLIA